MREIASVNKNKFVANNILFFLINVIVVYLFGFFDIQHLHSELIILVSLCLWLFVFDPFMYPIFITLILDLVKQNNEKEICVEISLFNTTCCIVLAVLVLICLIIEMSNIESISLIINIILVCFFQILFNLLYINNCKIKNN